MEVAVTKSHKQWTDPGFTEVAAYAKERKLQSTDFTGMLGVAHSHSHQLFGGKTQDAFIDSSRLPESRRDAARAIQSVLSNLNFNSLSGDTPLEKGASFGKIAEDMLGKDYMDKLESGMQVDPDQFAEWSKEIQRRQEDIEQMKKMKERKMQKQTAVGDAPPAHPEDEYAQLKEEDKLLLRALSRLNKIGGLHFGAQRRLVESFEGRIEKQSPMQYYEEVFDVQIFDMVMPDFLPRLAQMEFIVDKTWHWEMYKQEIALAIDISGSMSTQAKQAFVKGILAILFEGVSKGDTIVYITTFEWEMEDYVKIETREQAVAFFNGWSNRGGGDTNVSDVITKTQAMIRDGNISGHRLGPNCNPQLVIINDGQDRIEPTICVAPVHVISLEVDNPPLKQLADDSGGSFTLINSDAYCDPLLRRRSFHRW